MTTATNPLAAYDDSLNCPVEDSSGLTAPLAFPNVEVKDHWTPDESDTICSDGAVKKAPEALHGDRREKTHIEPSPTFEQVMSRRCGSALWALDGIRPYEAFLHRGGVL